MIGKTEWMGIPLLCLSAWGYAAATPHQGCDGTTLCAPGASATESPSKTAGGSYAVVSPFGKQTVPMITQAPRLTTLDGKTIAVVGGSFMAHVTHPEIRRLIQKQFPSARVILLNEIGSAGPFPPPGVTRRSKDEFQQNLRVMRVDAVISRNGGCGLCTPKETGSSIAAEYVGIPAVTIGAPGFVEQIYSTAVNNGVPAPRAATYPGAFATHTREQLIQNTREVLWPQIVQALTAPITSEEIEQRRKAVATDARDIAFTRTLDEINHYFTEMRWSDGLPITPPTTDRVEALLRFTDMKWDETVAVLPIAHRDTFWPRPSAGADFRATQRDAWPVHCP